MEQKNLEKLGMVVALIAIAIIIVLVLLLLTVLFLALWKTLFWLI